MLKIGQKIKLLWPDGTTIDLVVAAITQQRQQPLPPQADADQSSPAGWSVTQWCKEVGISRTMAYSLAADQKPSFVKIGRRRIITEPPHDWLRRMTA